MLTSQQPPAPPRNEPPPIVLVALVARSGRDQKHHNTLVPRWVFPFSV